jgi:hypothetical protein
MLTEPQAKALATVLHEIRPRWSAPAMLKVLERNAQHPATFADTCLAAITAAKDPLVDTPGCIYTDARFWPETARTHLPKPPHCEDHIGKEAHNCAGCWADIKAGQRPQTHIGKHYEATPTRVASLIQEDE